jgi:hypothetical protein
VLVVAVGWIAGKDGAVLEVAPTVATGESVARATVAGDTVGGTVCEIDGEGVGVPGEARQPLRRVAATGSQATATVR